MLHSQSTALAVVTALALSLSLPAEGKTGLQVLSVKGLKSVLRS